MQSIVRHIETKTYIKLERDTRIESNLQGNTSNIVTLKSMKSKKKKKDRGKKIGKRKEWKRDSCGSINGPKSRIHQYTIIGIQTQTKFRSLKKADKVLPNSPYKQNEIIKSLAKKYDIRIQLQEPILKGRKPTTSNRRRRAMDCKYLPRLIWDTAEEIWKFPRLLQLNICPWKGFFPFFFFFHTKKMIGSFPKIFIVLNVTQEKVFSIFSFFFIPKK